MNDIPLTKGPQAVGLLQNAPHQLIVDAGAAGMFAWDEFFAGMIRNKHTRTAYHNAVVKFLDWIAAHSVSLPRITPGMVGAYLDTLAISTPSKKLHLAAIRRFMDVLVQRHVIVLNPAHAVRTERYTVIEGKTPDIPIVEARRLLDSIGSDGLVSLRDKAILGILAFTAARAGAVAKLKIKDVQLEGSQYLLRFEEKGGKSRLIPVRHDLQEMILAYLHAAELFREPPHTPLFRTAKGNTGILTSRAVTGIDICRLMKRRLANVGIKGNYSPHSFRSCTATDLLQQGIPLEDVQHLLGHSDPRVTRLYDRRQKKVTRNIVERISV